MTTGRTPFSPGGSRYHVEDEPTSPTRLAADLDSISAGDAESAHAVADALLLASCPPEVRAAYGRLVERCGWWAYA
jgi:hypothetical protein